MSFIDDAEKDFFLAFWDLLDYHNDGKTINHKSRPGVPDHVYNLLSPDLKEKWNNLRIKPLPYLP